MVGHQIRLRGDDNFSSWQKKKGPEIFLFAYLGVHISYKMMHSRDT